MKTLSVRQPWAWAILNAEKRIENRSRADGRMPSLCSYRGPLLIHASAGCTQVEYGEAARWMIAQRLVRASEGALGPQHVPVIPHFRDLLRGGIVGVCNVVAHAMLSGRAFTDPMCTVDGAGPNAVNIPDLDRRWHIPGSYGLVLADVRPLPFTPFKGALGLFDVPDDIALPLLGQPIQPREVQS